jgi:hypothetical protein
MEQQTNAKQNKLKTYLMIGVAVAVGVLVQQFLFKAPAFDKQLAAAASEINKTCPMMVDEETRLDNAMAMPGNEIVYNYTLTNTIKEDVDVDKLREILTPHILNVIKTSPDLKVFRDNDTKMSYEYKDKNSMHLLKLSFAADQYK